MAPILLKADTRWAVVRVLAAPVGYEAVEVGGGGGGGGGGGPPPNRGGGAPAGAPCPWSGLMFVSDVGKGVPEARGGRV